MRIISTVEAAKRLNVTPDRVRKMIAAKRLKAIKVGREWLIDPKDLEAVKERKVGRPPRHVSAAKSANNFSIGSLDSLESLVDTMSLT